jgi:putative DNA primase/helicase
VANDDEPQDPKAKLVWLNEERKRRRQARRDAPHDAEMAAAFVDAYGGKLRYCRDLGGWLVWNGTRYCRDQRYAVLEMAQEFCTDQAAALQVKSLGGRRQIDSVLHLARALDPIATEPREWDGDPDVLCTPGGIVELSTGLLRPATPADYCTRQTRDTPKGACPLFLRTLKQIFLDTPSLIPFLQVWLGYCLTGHNRERKFVFAHGGGSNGKDTVFDLARTLLGDYADIVPIETLLASKHDRHPTEVAMLHGLRLGVASETPKNRRWNEARVKLLTGGGRVSARRMHGNFFSFIMAAKLVVLGNEQPVLTTLDEAWRDRMLFLPFLQQFTGKRVNKKLKDELLVREGPGILRWFVEGAVRWYSDGLTIPKEIIAATDTYMTEQDVYGRWLDECIDTGNAQAKSYLKDLFVSWETWCEREREHAGTPNALSRDLAKRHPRAKHKDEKGVVFRGLHVGKLKRGNPSGQSGPAGRK